MKRPFGIYPVTLLSFFVTALLTGRLARLVAPHLPSEGFPGDVGDTLAGLGVFACMIHAYYLLQLRVFNRGLAVVAFGIFSIALANSILEKLFTDSESTSRAFVSIPNSLIVIALNLVCIWYLSRRSFQEFSVAFVDTKQLERRKRDMQKASWEKTRRG